MEETVRKWIKISEYDLQTAEAMLMTGRYLYVAFMCQQAIEKILKAIYAQNKKELPPRTHNLLYLIDVLKLEIADLDKELLSQLNQFYLESRYPEDQNQLAKEMNENKGRGYLNKTRETWKCLRQMLP